MRYDELQDKVKEYQSGLVQPTPSWLEGWDSSSDNAVEDRRKRYQEHLFSKMGAKGRAIDNAIGQLETNLSVGDVSEEALSSGYGQFRKDYDTPYDIWKQDPTNYRANSQSAIGKLGNGLAKMIPYAATTYLDNTLGLVAGIANIGVDAVNGGEFHLLNSFVDTSFAREMQNVRDWSERFLPNYRTTEETEDADHWWRHMNANFWGDTVLKNLGFTLGAALSGLTYVKGFEALSGIKSGKLMRDAYNAALAAASGDAKAASAFQRILQGGKMLNPKAAYDIFGEMADSYAKLGWKSNLIGGIGGAIGESRVEAINASREHIQAVNDGANADYENGKQMLIERISSMPEFLDENGNVNIAGQNYYATELARLQQKYKDTMAVAEDESVALANTVFALNMPLLTASNIIMFGRMYSGGYNSQQKALAKGVLGSLTPSATKLDFVTAPLKNTISEGVEELSQKIFSEGAKDIASQRMAYFHDRQYDKRALRLTSGWVTSMLKSAQNVLLDPTSWEEFAVGALTGALGMPSSHGWSGGIIGGIQEAKQNYENSQKLTKEMNDAVNDSNFKRALLGLTRIVSEEEDKQDALKKGNEFAWHTLNDEQMMSTVMLFSRAGMLQELENYARSFKDINEGNISEFRSTLNPQYDEELLKKSNPELVDWIHKRADSALKAIQQYHDFYRAIDFISFGTLSDSAIEELIFTEAQLKNFEGRYNDLLSDVWRQIQPRLVDVSHETTSSGEMTARAKKAQELLDKHERLGSIFGVESTALKGIEWDKSASEASVNFKEIDDAYQQEVLDTLDELGSFSSQPALKQKVEDLQKLVRARQDFYTKLFDPMNKESFAERHEREAKQDSQAADDIKEDLTEKKIEEHLDSLEAAPDFKTFYSLYNSIHDFDDSEEAMKEFASTLASDDKLTDFSKRLSEADIFLGDVLDSVNEYLKNIPETDTELRGPYEYLKSVVEDMAEDMSEDIEDLPDDKDIALHLAEKILKRYAPGSRARSTAVSILKEALGNKELADSLGAVPEPAPSPQPAPSPAPVPSSLQPGEAFKREEQKLLGITDRNDTYLNRIVNGDFTGIDGLDDKEKEALVALASSVLSDLDNKAGLIGNGSDDSGIEDKSEEELSKESMEFRKTDVKTVRGYDVPVYDIKKLRMGVAEKSAGKEKTTKATLNWMNAHKVQEIVDSGMLAKLNEYYVNKKGTKLPVYFLANPHYVEDNLDANPFILKINNPKYPHSINMLMAIEVTDEIRNGVLAPYEKAGLFSNDTLITVNDGGNNVQYLVIGEVFNPSPQWIANQPGMFQDGYKGMKSNVNLIWDYAVENSVKPQYQEDIKNASAAPIGPEGRWYVAKVHPETDGVKDYSKGERISTTINYILPGRAHTMMNENEATTGETHKRRLGDALREYKKYGGEYHFALNTNALGTLYTKGSPGISLSIQPAPGSLWIATRNPNGVLEWSYVRVARTDEFTDSEWENSTGILTQIRQSFDVIFKPLDRDATQEEFRNRLQEKRDAANVIRNLIYLGKGNTLTFNWDNDGMVWVGIGDNACVSTSDAIRVLRQGQYRFQVGKLAMANKSILDQFADEGILQTDKVSFINKGASFGVNPLSDTDPNDSTKKVPLYATQSDNKVSFVFSSTVRGRANIGVVSNISIPHKRSSYSYNPLTDEVIRRTKAYPEGIAEDKPEIIAQVKAIAELMTLGGMEYPGIHRIKKTANEHTELFERTINNIDVRIIKRGESGAYMLCLDNDAWNDAIEGSVVVAKEGEENPEQPAPESRPEASPAQKEVTPISDIRPEDMKKPVAGPGRPTQTIDEKTKDDNKLEDYINCGLLD